MIDISVKFRSNKYEFSVDPNEITLEALKNRIKSHFGLSTVKLMNLFQKNNHQYMHDNDRRLLISLPLKYINNNKLRLMAIGQKQQVLEQLEAKEIVYKNEMIERERQQETIREKHRKLQQERERIERIERERQELEAREQALRMQKEREEFERLGVHIRLELKCIPLTTTTNNNSIVLPPSVLERIVSMNVEFPLIFSIDNDDNRTFYVGVSEFTAPENTCIVPQTVLDLFSLRENDLLKLHTVGNKVPYGKYCVLQPQNDAWFLIPEHERHAVLEFELRRRHFLQCNTSFCIEYLGKSHVLNVVSLVPEELKVIKISNLDLSVDMLAAIEKTEYETFDLVHDDDEVQLNIKSNEKSVFYGFIKDTGDSGGIICAQSSSNNIDIDMYASLTEHKPSPSMYDVKDDVNLSNTCEISLIPNTTYYIAVYCYNINEDEEIEHTITMTRKTMSSKNGHSIRNTNPDIDLELFERCKNCNTFVNKKTMVLHSAQCQRRKVHCQQCKMIIERKGLRKHQLLAHTVYQCTYCDESYEQEPMLIHRNDKHRIVNCIYCPLRLLLNQRGEHQNICGLRDITCEYCGENLKRKTYKRHCDKVHSHDLNK